MLFNVGKKGHPSSQRLVTTTMGNSYSYLTFVVHGMRSYGGGKTSPAVVPHIVGAVWL